MPLSKETIERAHEEARQLAVRGDPAAAVRVLSSIVHDLDAREANSGDLADLWWDFCESLADRERDRDPALAARLYALALVSHEKAGSMATGSGEGLEARRNLERVQAKLDTLSGRVRGTHARLLLALVDGGPGEHSYDGWSGTPPRKHTERGRVYTLFLVNPTGASFRDLSIESAQTSSDEMGVVEGRAGPRRITPLGPMEAFEMEVLPDYEFDFQHVFEVAGTSSEGGAFRVRFLLPKSAIDRSRWAEIAVLKRPGYAAAAEPSPDSNSPK